MAKSAAQGSLDAGTMKLFAARDMCAMVGGAVLAVSLPVFVVHQVGLVFI